MKLRRVYFDRYVGASVVGESGKRSFTSDMFDLDLDKASGLVTIRSLSTGEEVYAYAFEADLYPFPPPAPEAPPAPALRLVPPEAIEAVKEEYAEPRPRPTRKGASGTRTRQTGN